MARISNDRIRFARSSAASIADPGELETAGSADGHDVRVLAYTDATRWGGAEISLANLVGALAERFHVTVAGRDQSVVERIAACRVGARVELLPPVGSGSRVLTLAALRRRIDVLRPDVFHANLRAPWACQHELLAATLVRGVATVAVEQLPMAIPARRTRLLKRVVSRRLDAHIAVSARSADEITVQAGRPVRVIYNGVPDRPELVQEVRPIGVTVGTLAALDARKGLDVLLRACALLDRAQVLLVGQGGERDALQALADRLGLGRRVTFVEHADDARALLAQMDVFVLPSWREGFPLSIVEAMLASLPVVCTDVGGCAEAVADGVTGRVIAPGDVGGLADALASLLGDPDSRARLGQQGRAVALERFTDVTMARAFESVYAEVLRQRPRAGPQRPGYHDGRGAPTRSARWLGTKRQFERT